MAIINRGQCACCQTTPTPSFIFSIHAAQVWVNKYQRSIGSRTLQAGELYIADYDFEVKDGSTPVVTYQEYSLLGHAFVVGTAGASDSYIDVSYTFTFSYLSKTYQCSFFARTPYQGSSSSTDYMYENPDGRTDVMSVTFTEIQ